MQAGQLASLALDSTKRLRHAALHSAGHAVDRAVVGAVGLGVFSPLKGYHFEDSPYVEYRGKLPEGLDKEAFVERVRARVCMYVCMYGMFVQEFQFFNIQPE